MSPRHTYPPGRRPPPPNSGQWTVAILRDLQHAWAWRHHRPIDNADQPANGDSE